MLSVIVVICSLATAPSDCSQDHALLVLKGGEVALPTACMKEGELLLSRSALKPNEGEYAKTLCPRVKNG
jgi:hypothetical protein